MSARSKLLRVLAIGIGMVLSGCGGGGGGSSSKPVVSVSLSPATSQAIDQGQKIQFTGTVTNDTGTDGVTWTQTGPGSLSNQTTSAATFTASGTAGSATVTATSVADSTKSAVVNIAITAVPTFTTTTLPAGTIGSPYNQALAVTGGAGTLTYSIDSGTLPAGLSLNASTGAITGTPTGTAGMASFTAKVTDASTVAPLSATVPLSISINAAPPAIATISLLNPMVGEPYHQTLQSTGGTLPVTWSVPPGTLPAGFTLDPSTGTIAGTATASEVGTTNFTVQLTDSSSPTPLTATQPLSLTITTATACGTGSESLLNGQYAMSLTGFDASGPVGMLASFTADGTGKITAGVEDINSAASGGLQTNVPVTAASSSYSVGSDRRGCLTLVTSLGTRVFRFSLGIINTGVAADGRAIEFDTTGTNTTGSFDLQTPAAFSNAAVTGDFAFTAHSALTAAAGGGFLAAVGVLNLSGTAVTGSGDININGSVDPGNTGYPATAMTFTPGTYNIGPNGRGTLSFTVPTSPTPTTINAIIYVLNITQMYLMSSDPQSSTSSLFSGFAGQQTGRPYTNASLSQSAVLFAAGQTAGTGNASRVEAGVFAPDGSGNFTFAGDQNSGGTTSTPTAAGTFTVASNGRVLVMNSGSTTPALILYMVLPNWTYVLSTDNHVMIGYTEPQSGGPFTNTSLSGTFEFGTILPVVAANPLTAGVATYDGNGNVTATFDINENGFLSLGNVVTGTYAASSSGRVLTPASGATRRVTYIADPTTVFSLGYASTDANPTLLLMNQ